MRIFKYILIFPSHDPIRMYTYIHVYIEGTTAISQDINSLKSFSLHSVVDFQKLCTKMELNAKMCRHYATVLVKNDSYENIYDYNHISYLGKP